MTARVPARHTNPRRTAPSTIYLTFEGFARVQNRRRQVDLGPSWHPAQSGDALVRAAAGGRGGTERASRRLRRLRLTSRFQLVVVGTLHSVTRHFAGTAAFPAPALVNRRHPQPVPPPRRSWWNTTIQPPEGLYTAREIAITGLARVRECGVIERVKAFAAVCSRTFLRAVVKAARAVLTRRLSHSTTSGSQT